MDRRPYGSLDGVVAAAEAIKGVAGENLRQALDWLPMGRRLITVVTDCDLAGHVPGWPALEALALPGGPRRACWTSTSAGRFSAGARTWGPLGEPFRALERRRRHPPMPGRRRAGSPREYETVSTWGALDAGWPSIRAAPLVALDTETDSLDGMRGAHRRHQLRR